MGMFALMTYIHILVANPSRGGGGGGENYLKMCSRLVSLIFFKGVVIMIFISDYSVSQCILDDEDNLPPSPSYSLPSPFHSPSSPVASSQNSSIIIESPPPSLKVEQEMVCYTAKR